MSLSGQPSSSLFSRFQTGRWAVCRCHSGLVRPSGAWCFAVGSCLACFGKQQGFLSSFLSVPEGTLGSSSLRFWACPSFRSSVFCCRGLLLCFGKQQGFGKQQSSGSSGSSSRRRYIHSVFFLSLGFRRDVKQFLASILGLSVLQGHRVLLSGSAFAAMASRKAASAAAAAAAGIHSVYIPSSSVHQQQQQQQVQVYTFRPLLFSWFQKGR